jgi:hypothetical protein
MRSRQWVRFEIWVVFSHLCSTFAANQRKPPSIHETHNQYNKLPPLTPLELARMKADKDQRESHDIQLARRRQEEAMRQNLLREQAQRGGISHVGLSAMYLWFHSNIYSRVAQPLNHRINSSNHNPRLLRLLSPKSNRDKPIRLSKHSCNSSSSWLSCSSFRHNSRPISRLGGPMCLQLSYRIDKHGWPRGPLRTGDLSIRKRKHRHRRISCSRSERCRFRCSCRRLLKPTWCV